MSSEKGSKSILSYPNAVDILVFLFESGGSSKATHIQEGVGLNYNSLKNSAAKLNEEKLVTIVETKGKSRHITYALTPLGEGIAKDLKKAKDRLKGITQQEDEPMYHEPSPESENKVS